LKNGIDLPRQARDKHTYGKVPGITRGIVFWFLQVKAVRYVRDKAAAAQPRSGKGGAPPEKTIGGGSVPEKTIGGGGGGGEGVREEFLVSWEGYPVRN
jgi:hypothetical protein